MIKKEGASYVLYNKEGSKKLGKHKTKAGALRQERAIWANKKKGK